MLLEFSVCAVDKNGNLINIYDVGQLKNCRIYF